MTHTEKKSGLAIAGFVTSISGLLISLTGIGAIIGIPAIIVGLVLASVALKKKQLYKKLSIAAIIISSIALISGGIGIRKVSQMASPLIQSGQEIQSLIENDPELKEQMKNKEFSEAFQTNLKKRMDARESELKDGELSGDTISIEETMKKVANILNEETKAAIKETKEQFKK